jgi:hypothetical protein
VIAAKVRLEVAIGWVESGSGSGRTSRVGFGFGSDGSCQFDFLEEIGSGSGQFTCYIFSDIRYISIGLKVI